jgi:hypothetical protein
MTALRILFHLQLPHQMKSLASQSTIHHQPLFWATLAACLALTMIAWLNLGTSEAPLAPCSPNFGAPIPVQKQNQTRAILATSTDPASSGTGKVIPPADGLASDENSAALLQQRLAELSIGPLEQMLAFVESLPEGDCKTTSWLQMLETISASPQPTSLLDAALKKTPPHLLTQAWSAVADGRAHHDPSEAMRWITTLPDSTVRESCALRIVSQWGSRDPSAALAWLDSQPADEHWEPLLQSIVASWASTQPAQAMEWAARMTNNDTDSSHISLTGLVERAIAEQIGP